MTLEHIRDRWIKYCGEVHLSTIGTYGRDDVCNECLDDAIREAVEEANTLNVSNIIEAAKDKIEAVDKAKADARKSLFKELEDEGLIRHDYGCSAEFNKGERSNQGDDPKHRCRCGLDNWREDMEASDDDNG